MPSKGSSLTLAICLVVIGETRVMIAPFLAVAATGSKVDWAFLEPAANRRGFLTTQRPLWGRA